METIFVVSLILLISAVILYAVMAILRAAKIALQSYLLLGGPLTREQRQSVVFLAINMAEPVFTLLGVFLLSAAAAAWQAYYVLFGLHAALLLLPIIGLTAADSRLRDFNRTLLQCAFLRIGTTLMIGLPFATRSAELGLFSVPFGVFGGTLCLWLQTKWAGRQLLMFRQWFLQPAPVPPASPVAVVAQAAPASAIPRVAPGPVLVRHTGQPIFCPLCQTATALYDEACPACGLLFRSRIPSALMKLQQYRPFRPLGDGGMSSVYLARDLVEGKLRVLKTLVSVDDQGKQVWQAVARACLEREAALLAGLDHPRIVRQVAYQSASKVPYLVLDYVAGPTLEQRLSRRGAHGETIAGRALAPGEALHHALSVAEVLCYLGGLPRPIQHLDIKPANLILPPGSHAPVVVDFGSARELPRIGGPGARITASLDNFGTPGYAAPEQYRGQPTLRSDVYGLAATLYHLLSDDDPTMHPLSFPALAQLPGDIAVVLRAALAHEPDERPAVATLRAELQRLATWYG